MVWGSKEIQRLIASLGEHEIGQSAYCVAAKACNHREEQLEKLLLYTMSDYSASQGRARSPRPTVLSSIYSNLSCPCEKKYHETRPLRAIKSTLIPTGI